MEHKRHTPVTKGFCEAVAPQGTGAGEQSALAEAFSEGVALAG